jgi:hypothetical protein
VKLVVVRNILEPLTRETYEVGAGPLWDQVSQHAEDIPRDGWVFFVDGVRVSDQAVLEDDDKIVHAAAMPSGAEITLASFLIQVAIAAALTYASSVLFPPPKPAKQRGSRRSATYAFDGIESSRVEGLPIQVIYGRIRLGGQVVNEYVSTTTSESTIHTLVSLGEGPIESIGDVTVDVDSEPESGEYFPNGVEVNGNALENLRGVQVDLRMGTNSQTAIPGFHKLYTYFLTELGMPGQKSSDLANASQFYVNPPPDNSVEYGTAYDDDWDTFGVAFDLVDPFDGFRARVAFNGLYEADSGTGDLEGATVVWQVRYRELDAGLNPITTGGPNGDGYVRLPPYTASRTTRDRFQEEVEYQFFDPQANSWQPATGFALDLNAASTLPTDSAVATISGPLTNIPDTVAEEVDPDNAAIIKRLTVSCWVYIPVLPPASSSMNTDGDGQYNNRRHIWLVDARDCGGTIVYNAASNGTTGSRGFALTLRPTKDKSTSKGDRYVWLPDFQVHGSPVTEGGNQRALYGGWNDDHGEQSDKYYDFSNFIKAGTWQLVTGVYESRYEDGLSDIVAAYLGSSNVANQGFQSNQGSDNYRRTNGGSPQKSGGTLYKHIRCRMTRSDGGAATFGAPDLTIGKRGAANGNPQIINPQNYPVLIDDVVIIEERLSSSQIATRASSKSPGNTYPLALAHYSFDSDGTNSITDVQGTQQQWFSDAALQDNATAGSTPGITFSYTSTDFRRIRARVEMLRLTYDSTNKNVVDDAEWVDVSGYLDDQLAYPNTALIGTSITADEQISGGQPGLTYIAKGRKVPVWDGQSETNPSVTYKFSANPAWCALDLATNSRYGLGEQFTFADVDLDRFLALANYCDEVVYDGSVSIGPDFPLVDGWTNVWFDKEATDDTTGLVRGALYFVGYPTTPSFNHQVGAFMRVFNTTGTGINLNVADGEGYEIAQVGYNLDSTSGGPTGAPGADTFMVKAYLYPGVTQGYSTTGERRFEFNGVFDEEENAWDALISVLSVARSAPRCPLRSGPQRQAPVCVVSPTAGGSWAA